MGWLNSDDLLTSWSLRTIAEVFTTYPSVRWIQGLHGWWNANGQLLASALVPKNIFDYLIGDYEWIQQESVFWRRSLWDQAGSRISDHYRLMVDGEPWSRFFRYEQLHSFSCLLAGYRQHTTNRALLHHEQCLQEMQQAITALRPHCSAQQLADARLLQCLSSLARHPLLRLLVGRRRLNSVAARVLFRGLYKRCGYPLIAWDRPSSSWSLTQLPFRSFG